MIAAVGSAVEWDPWTVSPSSASSAKGRNGTAELLAIIANENNDRIPTAARLSLDILARQ